MPRIDHFGLVAPFYDWIFKSAKTGRLLEFMELPASGALLDAGGGTGRISGLIANQELFIVIADLSFGMLKQAKQKNRLVPVCSHTETLPFPDASFNRVIMVDALHHVCDYARSINEMWRILIDDGILIIEEPDISTLPVKFIGLLEKVLLMRSKFVPPDRIAELFNFPNARVNVIRENYISWIIIKKFV